MIKTVKNCIFFLDYCINNSLNDNTYKCPNHSMEAQKWFKKWHYKLGG